MEAQFAKDIERYATKKKIGLWRTHPSLFFVTLFYILEGAFLGGFFFFERNQTGVYSNLFDYMPQGIYAVFFALSSLILATALLSRKHMLVRVGAGIQLVPNTMMVVNFIFLVFTTGSIGLIAAVFKWGLTCLMLGLMMFEPFVNPNSAR